MRSARSLLPMLLVPLMLAACATTTRMPVTDVPTGNYVLVEPQQDTYMAVSIGEWAHSLRAGDETWTGQHWLDAEGRLHTVDDTGECAGMEAIWTYQYTGNRLTMDLVSDECPTREIPERLVYERR